MPGTQPTYSDWAILGTFALVFDRTQSRPTQGLGRPSIKGCGISDQVEIPFPVLITKWESDVIHWVLMAVQICSRAL